MSHKELYVLIKALDLWQGFTLSGFYSGEQTVDICKVGLMEDIMLKCKITLQWPKM